MNKFFDRIKNNLKNKINIKRINKNIKNEIAEIIGMSRANENCENIKTSLTNKTNEMNFAKQRFKKVSMIIMLTFMLCFTFQIEANALVNSGKFLDELYVEGTKELVLEDEIIDINVKEGKVSSTYTISNSLDTSIKAKLKFPVRANYKTEGKAGEVKDTTNFDVFIGDTKVVVNEEAEEVKVREFDYWYTFEVTFEPGKSKTIKIVYETIWKVDDDYSVLVGSFRTEGGPFKDKIKHTKITFDFADLTDYYVISPDDNSIYKRVENKYVWEASNYLPAEDIALIMRPKLLESNQINVSYYDNADGLKDKKILIDIDSCYTKTEIEKETINSAAIKLKEKLEDAMAEVALSNNIEEFEKEIKGDAEFDYIITLICKTSSDPIIKDKTISFESLEKGNEDKYIESKKLAEFVVNSGISGIGNIFTNLKNNNLITEENILTIDDEIVVSQTDYYNVPRIVVSLGYTSDFTKDYNNYDEVLEKVRLGLVLREENKKLTETKTSENKIVTKLDYKITKGKKNAFDKIMTKVNKFFKYNMTTIIVCTILGLVVGIALFVMIINLFEKKMKEKYVTESDRKDEKANTSKKSNDENDKTNKTKSKSFSKARTLDKDDMSDEDNIQVYKYKKGKVRNVNISIHKKENKIIKALKNIWKNIRKTIFKK